jgi:hypothetical protein
MMNKPLTLNLSDCGIRRDTFNGMPYHLARACAINMVADYLLHNPSTFTELLFNWADAEVNFITGAVAIPQRSEDEIYSLFAKFVI